VVIRFNGKNKEKSGVKKYLAFCYFYRSKIVNGEYYSAETCSKPRSYTAVYEEGQARSIQFKKPDNVLYIPAKHDRWDED